MLSFTLILVLPVIFFLFFFLKNYRSNYQEAIIRQARNILENDRNELDSELENINNIVSYNSLLPQMGRRSLSKQINDTKVIATLRAEVTTHSFLSDIEYYHESRPGHLFSSDGLYSLKYYMLLKQNRSDADFYLKQCEEAGSGGWVVQKKEGQEGEGRLQFVLKGQNSWWRFCIAGEQLEEKFWEEGCITVLESADGQTLYRQPGEIPEKQKVVLEAESVSGTFRLIRTLDKEFLFREVEAWQNYFFLLVALVLLAGGFLVLTLSRFHAAPLEKLEASYRETVEMIPDDVRGFDIFDYARKRMEDEIAFLEEKSCKERLLFQLVFGVNCQTEKFAETMRENNLFHMAVSWRVVLVVLRKENDSDRVRSLIDCIPGEECELQLLETDSGSTMLMIAGMADRGDALLEKSLYYLAEQIQKEPESGIRFFVGTKCDRYRDIYQSCQSVLGGREQAGRGAQDAGSEKVISYMPEIKKAAPFAYPDKKLEQLRRRLAKNEAAMEPLKMSKQDDALIPAVMSYIEEHYQEYSMSAGMVADHFGISLSNLSHQFKKQTGRTLLDFITEKKFVYAGELLENTDFSIKKISEMMHYSQTASFARKFKQYYGMNPMEYRSAAREKDNGLDEEGGRI